MDCKAALIRWLLITIASKLEGTKRHCEVEYNGVFCRLRLNLQSFL